jgi:hypothetical protein
MDISTAATASSFTSWAVLLLLAAVAVVLYTAGAHSTSLIHTRHVPQQGRPWPNLHTDEANC